ncbi:20916_t:CDS:2 [Dentiscutata erythropus]|uniref:20916_t:CDS:1 n=1 Tax=Dentiscutata erythropus TaxID=1348616 RepID=A0A9N9DXM8_9GLOM|nr:20916_t:CDS:2 [Dentiscutata erythropus]
MSRDSSSHALSYMSGNNNAWLTNNYPTPDNAQSPPTNNSVSTSQPTNSPKNVSNSQQSQPRNITRDSSFLSDLPSGTFFSEEPLLGSATSVPPFSHDLNDTFPNTPPEGTHDHSVQKERVNPYICSFQGEDETNLSHSQQSPRGNQITSTLGAGLLNANDRLIMNTTSHVDQLGLPTNDLENDWNLLTQYQGDYFLPMPSHVGYDSVLYDEQNVSVPFISDNLNPESQKDVIKLDISKDDIINIEDTGFSREHDTIPVSQSQANSENITIDTRSQLSENAIVNSECDDAEFSDLWISMNQVSDALRRQSDYFENMSSMFSTMEFAKVEPQSDDDITTPTTTVSETRRSMRPRNKTSYNYPRYSYSSGRRSKKRRRKYPHRSRSHSATENEADVDDISNSGHGHQVESDEHTHELSPVQSDREEIPEDVSSITESVNNSSNFSREHDLRSRKVTPNYKGAGTTPIATRRAKRIKTSPKIPIQKTSNNVKTTPKRKNIRRKSAKPIKVEKPVKPTKTTKLTKNTRPTYSRKRKDDSEWVMDDDDNDNDSDSETQDSPIVSAPAKRQRPPPKSRIPSIIIPRTSKISAAAKRKTRSPKQITPKQIPKQIPKPVVLYEEDAEIEIDPVQRDPTRPKRTPKNVTSLVDTPRKKVTPKKNVTSLVDTPRKKVTPKKKNVTSLVDTPTKKVTPKKNVASLVDTPTKKVTPKRGRKPKTTRVSNQKRGKKRSRASSTVSGHAIFDEPPILDPDLVAVSDDPNVLANADRSSTASGHAIFDKPPILDPDLVAVSADDPNVLANAVRVLTAGQTYDIVDTPASTPVSLTDNSRLSTPSPVFIKPGKPKSRSASFTNVDRPVLLESGSSSTQTSAVWTRDHWIQLKGLYEDTKNEYIQNGKAGRGSEDVYRDVVAKFIMINTDNKSFGEDNIRKRIIALEAAEFERHSNILSRRSSVDSTSSIGSRPSVSHYNSAYANMRDTPVTKRKRSGSTLTNLETEDEIEQSPSVRRRRVSSSSLSEEKPQVSPATSNSNGI